MTPSRPLARHALRASATAVIVAALAVTTWGVPASANDDPAATAPAASATTAAASPSASPSPSVSPTPSATPEPSVSASPTPEPSATASATPEPTPTAQETTDPEETDGKDTESQGPVTTPAQRSPLARAATADTSALAATATIHFTDVSSSKSSSAYSPFAKEIAWLASTGVTRGWTLANGTREYRPLDTVARDAMAAFLYRYAGQPAYSAPSRSPFLDIRTSTAFYKEITWTSASKVSTGWRVSGGAQYRPSADISREAMAAFLYRFAGSPAVSVPSTSPFKDVSTSSPFYKEIVWLASTGATTGWRTSSGAEFRPRASITRDAMAAFLYRLDRAGIGYAGSTAAATTLRHTTMYVYGASLLNVRSSPSTSGSVIASVVRDTALRTTGKVSADGWIQVIVNGKRGWSHGYYLTGRNGAVLTKTKAENSNGKIPRGKMCTLSWDSSEMLLCAAKADLEKAQCEVPCEVRHEHPDQRLVPRL
ncbi:SH3 domain-containing protein [Demequina litorisediminis]|uniref:SH3 domain-containing protein n=1 Tax=Demequina litorisediminis TaxID=1849022 RepID=UPI0024E0D185|nr:SH3 domain-containing protein [Demequina litorisediminis]